MIGRTFLTHGAIVLALAAAPPPARADAAADACRTAPTRACVLEAAAAAADAFPQPYARASSLAVVAAAEQRAGLAELAAATLARAAEAAKQIPADFEYGTTPPGIVVARAEMGDVAGALALARGFANPLPRVFALDGVAAALQRQGRVEEAKANFGLAVATAESAPVERRAFLLLQVARVEARVGSLDAPATFDLAIAAAKSTNSASDRTFVIGQRIRAGEFVRAYVDINDLPEDSRDFLLQRLVAAQADAGEIDDAAEVAPSISRNSDRVVAYANVAAAEFRAGRAMAGAKMLVSAQEDAATETTPALKGEAAAAIAGAEAVGGMTSRSEAHLAEARAALDAETDEVFRRSLGQAVARALARAGETQRAIEMLSAHVDPAMQSLALYDMAADLIAAKQNGEAFAILNATPANEARGAALLEFAEKLAN